MPRRKKVPEYAPPKSKKRVAFTTANAATKSILVRNAGASLLLRLPPEIRIRIFTAAIGDHLLHIEPVVFGSHTYPDGEELYIRSYCTSSSRLSAMICEVDCQEAPDEKKTLKSATGKEPERVWLPPHVDCFSCPGDLPHRKRGYKFKFLEISLLRTCRQIYADAHPILYTTNTFSFTSGDTLTCFVDRLMTPQKRLLRSLRFEMSWPHQECWGWNHALILRRIRTLTGLRNLRLGIQYSQTKENFARLGSSNSWDMIRIKSAEGLCRLAVLPLTSVEVGIWDHRHNHRQPYLMWDERQKRAFADALRNVLLDPNGEESWAKRVREDREELRASRERDAERRRRILAEHQAQASKS